MELSQILDGLQFKSWDGKEVFLFFGSSCCTLFFSQLGKVIHILFRLSLYLYAVVSQVRSDMLLLDFRASHYEALLIITSVQKKIDQSRDHSRSIKSMEQCVILNHSKKCFSVIHCVLLQVVSVLFIDLIWSVLQLKIPVLFC